MPNGAGQTVQNRLLIFVNVRVRNAGIVHMQVLVFFHPGTSFCFFWRKTPHYFPK